MPTKQVKRATLLSILKPKSVYHSNGEERPTQHRLNINNKTKKGICYATGLSVPLEMWLSSVTCYDNGPYMLFKAFAINPFSIAITIYLRLSSLK
jgi:hypothetical protein